MMLPDRADEATDKGSKEAPLQCAVERQSPDRRFRPKPVRHPLANPNNYRKSRNNAVHNYISQIVPDT